MLEYLTGAIRRNHALEHATVTLLLAGIRPTRMAARAWRDGFYLWGKVTPEALEVSVREALARLKNGEASLAVTPLCGTNIAVGGLLVGAAAMVAGGRRRAIDRFPSMATAAMLAIIAAPPIGQLVQKYVTTCPDLKHMEIVGVRSFGGNLYKVETRWSPPRLA